MRVTPSPWISVDASLCISWIDLERPNEDLWLDGAMACEVSKIQCRRPVRVVFPPAAIYNSCGGDP